MNSRAYDEHYGRSSGRPGPRGPYQVDPITPLEAARTGSGAGVIEYRAVEPSDDAATSEGAAECVRLSAQGRHPTASSSPRSKGP
jgi:hypothetical protein